MRHVVWFRGRDLRVEDQPALAQAAARGQVIPVAFLPQEVASPQRRADHLQALSHLRASLRALGSDLILLEGDPLVVLPERVLAWGAQAVFGQARVEPAWRERDALLGERLAAQGTPLCLLEGDTLMSPGGLRTGSGGPYRVFTPFARAFRARVAVPLPEPAPRNLGACPVPVTEVPLPVPDAAAECRLAAFLAQRLDDYPRHRDRLDLPEGTSRLGPELRRGTLSVRRVWWEASRAEAPEVAVACFLNELLWREFAWHLLWEQPELARQPFRAAWEDFPWEGEGEALEAWKAGRTGIPLVDAAARELLATGHVHNRARMIAACFLTKHLQVDWRLGEAHYRAWLRDGCQAANVMNWQWSAGCGVDAQPWFRIFNPGAQGLRFDPEGTYVRRWVPELAAVPLRHLHEPHRWGRPLDYPEPMVSPALGRDRFLAAARAHLG